MLNYQSYNFVSSSLFLAFPFSVGFSFFLRIGQEMMPRESNAEPRSKNVCAACKYVKRKCNECCLLSPYFPVERMADLEAAHRVFGISNMNKMIKRLQVQDRDKAAKSLLWEALIWKQDPVNGPLGQYWKLERENQFLKNQLNLQQQVLPYAAMGMQEFNGKETVPNSDFVTNFETLELDLTMITGTGNTEQLLSSLSSPLWPNPQDQQSISEERKLPSFRAKEAGNPERSQEISFCEQGESTVGSNFVHGQQRLTQNTGDFHCPRSAPEPSSRRPEKARTDGSSRS